MKYSTVSKRDHSSHYRLVKMLGLRDTKAAIDGSGLYRDFGKYVVGSGVNKYQKFSSHDERWGTSA
jgi:hypothetical protein